MENNVKNIIRVGTCGVYNPDYKIGDIAVATNSVTTSNYRNIFKGKVNCFYISPFVQSPLAVFKNIYASCGWLVNMLLLMLGITIASAVIYFIGYVIRKKQKTT